MNDIGGFTELDLCIIYLAFGGMGILVSGILFLIQERLARRDQRPVPAAVPKAPFHYVHTLRGSVSSK